MHVRQKQMEQTIQQIWEADPQKIGEPLTFEQLKLCRKMFMACKRKPIIPEIRIIISEKEYDHLKQAGHI